MASKNKPYERFGPYLLFKKLESDALGDLFRAAPIDGDHLAPFVALRRLSGGNREALAAAAQTAQQVASSLSGPTFVKNQRIDVIAGTAALAYDYASGRSLRAVVDRARGNGAPPNPIPLDQALVIAERVALSLATTAELRLGGERLLHGALIPQFVWISEDGEIRVAGQQLGPGIVASLHDEKVAAEIGRYLAPETHHTGAASRSTEVYALGAILYLAATGLEPPDPTRTSAFTHAIRAARTMAGAPMPDEIRTILEKSLNIDPSSRYETPADMRTALSALTASGRYSATSFNLAFYLSNLLKKEIESEAAEREREAKTSLAPYLAAETELAPLPAAAAREGRSRAPLAIAATLLLAAVGAGAWLFLTAEKEVAPAAAANLASMTTAQPVQQRVVLPEPILASAPSPDTAPPLPEAPTQTTDDQAARKKAFDDAVKKRLQEELLKLQAEHTRQLQQQQAMNAPLPGTAAPPAQTTAAPPAAEERVAPAAAQLDQPRRETAAQEETLSSLPQQAGLAPSPVVPAPIEPAPVPLTAPAPASTQTSAPPPAAPAVREGDVVDMNDLDELPTAIREPRPVYPPIAARQRIEATVMASILISETGEVLDVKILRGDPRFGFNDSAVRAFRSARYTPAMKDGKRVKTWVAQMIQFRP
ncbi:MAG TPA: TonB family protein [Thermoanaerobaculia bacterium]|nr:TonB family protein [Thermoanaerobaculia bacterium]